MKKWYSKWWIWCIFLLMAVLIFYVIKIYPNFDDVNSGDLLNFYGALLSFIGTIVLGVVASHQSWKANRLSERLLKIEEERFLPIVDIQEIMEFPDNLAPNTYNNCLNITLNSSFFDFNEKNEIEYNENPILVFNLKNICSNHIISIQVDNIEQKTIFENKKSIVTPVEHLEFNGGIRVLGLEEKQFLLISGVHLESPKGLSEKQRISMRYANPVVELIITFQLSNIKGQKFKEVIKLSFLYFPFIEKDKLQFPCITEKEIISISPVK